MKHDDGRGGLVPVGDIPIDVLGGSAFSVSPHPHAVTHAAHGPDARVLDGCSDGRGSRGPGGRCIRHAPEATPRAVGPLVEPAFRAALMPCVRALPLAPLRGCAAGLPTVSLPPVVGPTEVETVRYPAPRQRTVRHRSALALTPARVPVGCDHAYTDPGALAVARAREPAGRTRVGVTISARARVASGHGGPPGLGRDRQAHLGTAAAGR